MIRALPKPTASPAAGRARVARPSGVTTAILLATAQHEGEAAALLPWAGDSTLAERLLDQLRSFGVTAFHVIGRPGPPGLAELAQRQADVTLHRSPSPAGDLELIAALARDGSGDLLLAQAELVVHRQALATLLADPRLRTAVLRAARDVAAPFGHRLRTRRGRVMSAASPFHAVREPNGTFLGLLKVAAADRAGLAAAADQLAALRADPPAAWVRQLDVVEPGSWRLALAGPPAGLEDEARAEEAAAQADLRGEPEPGAGVPAESPAAGAELPPDATAELERRLQAAREDVTALLLVGLVRADVPVGAGRLRGFFWARPLTPADAADAADRLARTDEDRIALDAAVKPGDGFFTTFFVSPYSRHIARWCARRGITPNQVTTFSMALGTLAAAGFATGDRWGLIAGALLLQAAFAFDCVDGQLARYTRTFSAFGAWLDSVFDRSKEYVAYAGLAIGGTAAGFDVWLLACAALALQTTRHFVDFSYPVVQEQALGPVRRPPLEQVGDGLTTGAAAPAPASSAASRPRRTARAGPWARRIVAFPIGERFALISLTAALWNARVTFIALLAWTGVAVAYLLAGRIVRSIRAGSAGAPGRLVRLRDDGPLASAIGRVLGPAIPVPATMLLAVAAAVLAVAAALTGDGASKVLAAIVVAAVIVLGGAAAGRPNDEPLRWAAAPLLRAIELGGIVWLAAIAGGGALPAAYALLAAIAFRHYDTVYRPHRRDGGAWGLGWDGRLALVCALVAASAVPGGLWAAAAAFAILFVGGAINNIEDKEIE